VFRRCVSIGAALSLWLFITKLERRPLRAYGLPPFREGKRHLRFGLLLGLGALAAMFGLGILSGVCSLAITPDASRLWRTTIGFLPIAFLVGILEELVFRGFILQHVATCSKMVAMATSSALYALVHVKTLLFDVSMWLELGGLFLLGTVLALSVLLTQQLYLAIGLHAALAYGARVNKLFVEFSNPSLSWLVGTNRLVNGLAGWTVLLVLGGIIVWWANRSPNAGEGGLGYGHA